MNPSKALKPLKAEQGVSQYFPITHLCAPHIFETEDGAIGSVLKVKGVPFVTETDEALNHYQRLFHQALLKLDHRFMLYETKVRKRQQVLLPGRFHNSFANAVNQKYQRRFKDSALYRNEIYLTILFKNQTKIGKEKLIDKTIRLARKLSDTVIKENIKAARRAAITSLDAKVSEIKSILAPFGAKRLGDDKPARHSDLLQFLSLIPNAGVSTLMQNKPVSPVGKGFKDCAQALSTYPKGHLGQYLCNHRLFFGNCIQFQGNTSDANKYAVMLSLKQYGAETANVMLDPLFNLKGEFILTQSFAPIERDVSIKSIKRAHSMKTNADDLSASQLAELGLLADLVTSEKLRCGLHHNTLMLMADSVSALDGLISEASRAYGLSNMSVVRETIAQIPSFFSQLPGNAKYIARSAMITSENFADFSALHTTQSGFCGENFLGSAVSLLETPANTPLYFNYHAKGSKTNPSRGHTLVIGGNDSGKTTLVSFLDAQMSRFEGHRSIFLDRNQGLKIYILAIGGKYVRVAPGDAAFTMNPLSLPDTPDNRDFIKAWFKALLLEDGEASLPDELAEICDDTIDYAFDELAPESRSLRHLANYLPIDFARMPALNRWLKATATKAAGQYAWVFDNDCDSLTLDANRFGFDITYVLDNLPVNIATPIFMYIMQRISLCLDGHVTSIVIDEMWQVLRAPYWQAWLAGRLPSIRKDFGHIIGMTQSPKTIVTSPINAELLDNLATMVLFPNPKADPEIYINQLGLNEAEYHFIKNTNPKSRLFLYKHEDESMIAKLDLSELSDEIRVFSANKASVALLDAVMAEVGESPCDWLPEFLKRSRL